MNNAFHEINISQSKKKFPSRDRFFSLAAIHSSAKNEISTVSKSEGKKDILFLNNSTRRVQMSHITFEHMLLPTKQCCSWCFLGAHNITSNIIYILVVITLTSNTYVYEKVAKVFFPPT